jgi:DNA polymerase elongation subunit (family B)
MSNEKTDLDKEKSETENVIKVDGKEEKGKEGKRTVTKDEEQQVSIEAPKDTNGGNWVVVNIVVAPERQFKDDIAEYLMDKSFPRKMHPLFSRIIMIGLKKQGMNPILIYGQKEKNILNRFWKYMEKVRPDKIITFNGYNFDVPFIHIRSKLNKIEPSYDLNTVKWRMEHSNHFDCMQLLSGKENFLNVALEISCRLLGLTVPDPRIRGEEIPGNYTIGNIEPIKTHCVQELEMTEQLFIRLEH